MSDVVDVTGALVETKITVEQPRKIHLHRETTSLSLSYSNMDEIREPLESGAEQDRHTQRETIETLKDTIQDLVNKVNYVVKRRLLNKSDRCSQMPRFTC